MDIVPVVIGVDVGGTNTDAVIVTKQENQAVVIATVKNPTSRDVTTGVETAIWSALNQAYNKGHTMSVIQVNIGTTHFINAAVQGKDLAKVAAIRLCGSVSQELPPFSDFPTHLKDVICGSVHLVKGGYRYDGAVIDEVDEDEIKSIIKSIKSDNISNIVLTGIFSPIRNKQELRVKEQIEKEYPEATISLSHEIGQVGLLERENAAILNECLKPLCKITIEGFKAALKQMGLSCPLYLTQNDGTIISAEDALQYPIYTFASGPTNSMRGAAYLCQLKDVLVVDIGGTTTDVGMLKNGFAREASTKIHIGGVKTNLKMPDVLSIGLGGGSYVVGNYEGDSLVSVSVGPLSAGYNLQKEALIFAEDLNDASSKMTATDIAVAAGLTNIGNNDVSYLDPGVVRLAKDKIHYMVECAIDKMKLSKQDLPVVLVGGGSILIDINREMRGASEVILPEHYGVANAVGAALCQVSARVDNVCNLLDMVDLDAMNKNIADAVKNVKVDPDGKEVEIAKENAQTPFFTDATNRAVNMACRNAIDAAVKSGAHRSSITITEKDYSSLAYIPGQVITIKIKAVGDLANWKQSHVTHTAWTPETSNNTQNKTTILPKPEKQMTTTTGNTISNDPSNDATQNPSEPFIDPSTGEWILSEWDIECIVVGAGIYGCGGGGSPNIGRLRCLKALREGKKLRVISPERLFHDADPIQDKVVCVGFMGAPLVLYEQLVTSAEIKWALAGLDDLYNIGKYDNGILENTEGVDIKTRADMTYVDNYHPPIPGKQHQEIKPAKNIIAIMPIEIGGANSVEPLIVSADLGIPTVDADGMGRAFPELQMFLPYIYGVLPYPAVLADHRDRRAIMLQTPSAKQLEHLFRDTVVEMGCCGGVALAPISKDDVLQKTILYSLSRVWQMGNAILRTRLEKVSPIDTILDVENSKHIITGKIQDVQRETIAGFNKGHLIIEGLNDFAGQYILIEFQNENLIVLPVSGDDKTATGSALACVPDLIVLVDADTGEPIPTEEVKYGLRVALIVLASHALLRTETALRFVGPQAFRYPDSVKFEPFSHAKPTKPIPPM